MKRASELRKAQEWRPMDEFLDAYSIQSWLESCPQGYLEGTVFGHGPDEREAPELLDDETFREHSIRTTVQLIVGERCALAASSGLINATPDEAAKRFLATQTLDEARHVEIFTQRLYDLGVQKKDLASTVKEHANPNLIRFAEVLLEKVHKNDFVAGVVGQNIILEGMALSVFEVILAMSRDVSPKLVHMLTGAIADERRHVGFGEQTIGALIRRHPEKRPDVEKMQRDMSYFMLAAFADAFRKNPMFSELRRARGVAGAVRRASWQGADLALMEPEQVEAVLSDAVLSEFKARFERLGLDYRTPARP